MASMSSVNCDFASRTTRHSTPVLFLQQVRKLRFWRQSFGPVGWPVPAYDAQAIDHLTVGETPLAERHRHPDTLVHRWGVGVVVALASCVIIILPRPRSLNVELWSSAAAGKGGEVLLFGVCAAVLVYVHDIFGKYLFLLILPLLLVTK